MSKLLELLISKKNSLEKKIIKYSIKTNHLLKTLSFYLYKLSYQKQ